MTLLQKHLVFVPLFCVGFFGIFGCVVMLLWNALMPEILGLPCISFWQAAGLLLLSKILIGSFGVGHHAHGCHHAHSNRLRERWENMTPEEREKFVEMHKTCCSNAKTDGES